MTNILAELDCPNRTQAVALALREGLYDKCVREIGRPVTEVLGARTRASRRVG